MNLYKCFAPDIFIYVYFFEIIISLKCIQPMFIVFFEFRLKGSVFLLERYIKL